MAGLEMSVIKSVELLKEATEYDNGGHYLQAAEKAKAAMEMARAGRGDARVAAWDNAYELVESSVRNGLASDVHGEIANDLRTIRREVRRMMREGIDGDGASHALQGRPSNRWKGAGPKKTAQIIVRCSPEEKELWFALAEERDTNLTELIATLLGKLKKKAD